MLNNGMVALNDGVENIFDKVMSGFKNVTHTTNDTIKRIVGKGNPAGSQTSKLNGLERTVKNIEKLSSLNNVESKEEPKEEVVKDKVDDSATQCGILSMMDRVDSDLTSINLSEGIFSKFTNISFNELFEDVIDEVEDDSRLKISQSADSVDQNEYSLFISSDNEVDPHIVIIPIGGRKAKVQAFYDPVYIYDKEYPHAITDIGLGLKSMILAFIKDGNGYGFLFEDGVLKI